MILKRGIRHLKRMLNNIPKKMQKNVKAKE